MLVLRYALAVLIGVTLGLLGGGGSILTVPVLVYVMHVDMKQAVPTSLVVVGLTSLVGAYHHWKAANVHLPAVAAFGPTAILGSLVGSQVALRVSGRLQLTIFAVVLVGASVRMLMGRGAPDAPATPSTRRPLPLVALLGAGVGVLTGLVGVGGGFLYVPALTLAGGLDMKKAVGTSLALITLSSAAGIAGYLGRVPLDWPLIGLFTVLAFLGVGLGSAMVRRVSQQGLRRAFAVLMLVMGVLVLIRR